MNEYDIDLANLLWQSKEIAELEKLKNQDKEIAEKFNAKIREVRQNIEKGWSTGDKIQDFIIYFALSLSNTELQNNLMELDNRLKGNTGKPVLVVSKREQPEGCTGFGHHGYVGVEQIMKLGILNGEEFIFKPKMKQTADDSLFLFLLDMGGIQLPAEKHAVLKDRYSTSKEQWQFAEGPISLCALEVQNLWKKLPEHGFMDEEFSGFDNLKGATQVYVGDDVELCLKHPSLVDDLFTVKEIKEREEYKQEYQKIFGKSADAKSGNKLYVEGMKLLSAEPAPEAKKKYDEELLKERKSIIEDLEYFIAAEKELKKNSANSNKVEGTIKATLKDAIDLSMHDIDLTLESYKGMKINVKEYIQGLCEQYQVEYKK